MPDLPLPAPPENNEGTFPEDPPLKPGWKTSEFVATMAGKLVMLLIGAGVIPAETTERIVSVIAAALVGIGYAVSRAMTKSAAVRKLAVVLLLALAVTHVSACAGGRDAILSKSLAGTEALQKSWLAYDAVEEQEIAATGTTAEARAALLAFRTGPLKKVNIAFLVAYAAITAASVDPNQGSLTAVTATVARLLASLAELGVIPAGGSK